jgi:hypothetical protein
MWQVNELKPTKSTFWSWNAHRRGRESPRIILDLKDMTGS